MAKYDPLRRYLRRQRGATSVILDFDMIERIIGAILPKAAAHAEWWGNDSKVPRAVQVTAWIDAGFLAELIPGEDRVRFTRRPPLTLGRSGGQIH